MKKIAYWFAAGTMILAACSSEPAYKISGTVEGIADGETIYLQKAANRKFINLDSTVVSNGTFVFNGRQDTAVVRYICINPTEGRKGISETFFLENGNINVVLGTERSSVKGTINNDIFQTYKNQENALTKEIMALYEQFKAEGITDEQKAEIEAKSTELSNKLDALTFSTIEANITNPVGIYLWPNNSYSMELAQLQALAAKVPAEYQSNERIANLLKRIEVLAKTSVGQKFTDFEMPTPDGKTLKLSDVIAKNKYTLIDFWASWCGPCRREMPNVVAAYKAYNKKGFGIVGVSLDSDAEAWKKAIKDLGMTWEHMSDVKGWQCEGAALYGVNSIPATVLVAQDGTIIERNLRGEAIAEKLKELLKSKHPIKYI